MQGAGRHPTAFLSYSHADQDRVRLLADALEQAGISVWWDTLIEGGAVFAKSVEVGDSGLVYARNDPLLDPLRNDSRFAQLLRSIGFE